MADGPAVYLDANVFIYAIEGDENVSAPVQTFLTAMRDRPGTAVTSELTLAEVLAPSKGRARPSPLKRQYMDLLIWSGIVGLQPVSRDILLETTKLRATETTARLRLPDAIHLATAIRAGCRFMVSNDDRMPVPHDMTLAKPHQATFATIVEALS